MCRCVQVAKGGWRSAAMGFKRGGRCAGQHRVCLDDVGAWLCQPVHPDMSGAAAAAAMPVDNHIERAVLKCGCAVHGQRSYCGN